VSFWFDLSLFQEEEHIHMLFHSVLKEKNANTNNYCPAVSASSLCHNQQQFHHRQFAQALKRSLFFGG
jgi:hypothetical protein